MLAGHVAEAGLKRITRGVPTQVVAIRQAVVLLVGECARAASPGNRRA